MILTVAYTCKNLAALLAFRDSFVDGTPANCTPAKLTVAL